MIQATVVLRNIALIRIAISATFGFVGRGFICVAFSYRPF